MFSVSDGFARPDCTRFKRTFNLLFSKLMQFILRSDFPSSHIKLDLFFFYSVTFVCSDRLRRHPETEQIFYDFKFCSFDGAVVIFAIIFFALTPSSGAFKRGAGFAFFAKPATLLKVLLDEFVRAFFQFT